MLSFGNKEFRNLQEQVLANMRNIQDIMEGTTVLADFGIKVIGQVDEASDLPDPSAYLEEGGEYGDAYVVGTEEPYEYYIFTRAFEGEEEPQWFDLGIFPVPGPQGPQGEQGPIGATPVISASASTETLSAGQSATVSVSKSGTAEYPSLTFSFGIPQGVQGVQGIQGPAGPQGEQGPQGIQGEQGETGYLYTILGQVSSTSLLPSPSTVMRTGAYLVGASEPYDVYIIIGETSADLEWVNIGPIATVLPNIYIASDTYASSGTLSADVLATIIAATDVHYLRDGDVYFQKASTLNGSAYYTSIGIDSGSGATEIGYLVVDLSDGSWEVDANVMPTDITNYITTNTAQTISGTKSLANNTFLSGLRTNDSSYSLIGMNSGNNVEIGNNASNIILRAYDAVTSKQDNTTDLGTSGNKFKTLYLTDSIQMKNPSSTGSVSINADAYNGVSFTCNGYSSFLISPFTSYARGNFCTTGSSNKDLGSTTYKWGDLYLSGKIQLGDSQYNYISLQNGAPFISSNTGAISTNGNIYPSGNGTKDIGSSSLKWKDEYLSGSLIFDTNYSVRKDGSTIKVKVNNADVLTVGSSSTAVNSTFRPNTNNERDLGTVDQKWKNLYLAGNLSDGTNSISVAQIGKVKTINNISPDANGNVSVSISGGGGDLSGTISFTKLGATSSQRYPIARVNYELKSYSDCGFEATDYTKTYDNTSVTPITFPASIGAVNITGENISASSYIKGHSAKVKNTGYLVTSSNGCYVTSVSSNVGLSMSGSGTIKIYGYPCSDGVSAYSCLGLTDGDEAYIEFVFENGSLVNADTNFVRTSPGGSIGDTGYYDIYMNTINRIEIDGVAGTIPATPSSAGNYYLKANNGAISWDTISGGTQLYEHYIEGGDNTYYFVFKVISTKSTSYSVNSVDPLDLSQFTDGIIGISQDYENDLWLFIPTSISIFYDNNNIHLNVYGADSNGDFIRSYTLDAQNFSFTDTATAL